MVREAVGKATRVSRQGYFQVLLFKRPRYLALALLVVNSKRVTFVWSYTMGILGCP